MQSSYELMINSQISTPPLVQPPLFQPPPPATPQLAFSTIIRELREQVKDLTDQLRERNKQVKYLSKQLLLLGREKLQVEDRVQRMEIEIQFREKTRRELKEGMNQYCNNILEEKGKLFKENRRQKRKIEQIEQQSSRKALDQQKVQIYLKQKILNLQEQLTSQIQFNVLLKETFAPSSEIARLIDDENRKVRVSSISPDLRLGTKKRNLQRQHDDEIIG